jgi:hypothetical protein
VTASARPDGNAESRKRANAVLLDAVRALWDANPEQRFGQLVMNLSREPGGFSDTWEWSNAYWHQRIQESYENWAARGGGA